VGRPGQHRPAEAAFGASDGSVPDAGKLRFCLLRAATTVLLAGTTIHAAGRTLVPKTGDQSSEEWREEKEGKECCGNGMSVQRQSRTDNSAHTTRICCLRRIRVDREHWCVAAWWWWIQTGASCPCPTRLAVGVPAFCSIQNTSC